MNDLLQAAKAVIDAEFVSQQRVAIENLRNAVERAESLETVGFEEWFKRFFLRHAPIDRQMLADQAWYSAVAFAQQAERNRIRARAKLAADKVWKAGDWYIGPQHHMIEKFVDALLEDSDE